MSEERRGICTCGASRGSSAARVAQTAAQLVVGARDATSRGEAVAADLLADTLDDSGAHGASAFEILLDAFREDFFNDRVARELAAAARVDGRFGELLVVCNDWLRDPEITGTARVALLVRVGVWYGDELGKPAWGIPYLEQARALSPRDPRVLRAFLRVQAAAGALSTCEPVLRRLLELDPTDREAEELLERILLGRGAIYDLVAFLEQRLRDSGSVALNPLRVRLAELHATLPGGEARACDLLAEAHALDGNNGVIVRALAKRLSARIERTDDDRERVELLMQLARLCDEDLLDAARARDLYRRALDLEPANTAALAALRRLALDEDDIAEAARLLDRQQRHTRDARARAKLLVVLAVLRRDRLADPRGSLHAFEEAHACDPDNEDAVHAVADAQRSDWDEAARLFERLPRSTKVRLEASPELLELQRAVGREPLELAHHRALYRHFLERGDDDRAYCVASALVFLKGADAEQRAFHEGLRPRGAPAFRTTLSRGAWLRALAHPDLDRGIGGVFEVIARAVRVTRSRALNARGQLPSLALARREDPRAPEHAAAETFFSAARVLGIVPPDVWLRPDVSFGITSLPIEPAASLLGAGVLSCASLPEQLFLFARHLAARVGEHGVRAHHTSALELEALLASALHLVVPSFAPRGQAFERARESLARELSSDELEQLRPIAPSVIELATRANVERWMQASELTAVRAGLLLCGDLSIAAKILRREANAATNEKVRDLVRFTVSDAYAELRRAVGIAVRSPSPSDEDEETRERSLCA